VTLVFFFLIFFVFLITVIVKCSKNRSPNPTVEIRRITPNSGSTSNQETRRVRESTNLGIRFNNSRSAVSVVETTKPDFEANLFDFELPSYEDAVKKY